MNIKSTKKSFISEKSASQRLSEALDAIRAERNEDVTTATALCERAGVSRNALYRYHRDILSELHKLQENIRQKKSNNSLPKLTLLKEENSRLKKDIEKLVALVDHYFTAWQESSVVAKRQERDLANSRKKTNHKFTVL